jgi:G3E family GTPase
MYSIPNKYFFIKENGSQVKVMIFGGFLGSGKTSLILSLAHHLIDQQKAFDKPELVIIENEIGETGIDDKVLKSSGYSVKELFAGCICCTLSVDIVTTMNDIYENINPKWVLIECTGIAYPGMVAETLQKYGKGIESIKIFTVIDAERWRELLDITPVLVKTQINQGEALFINKIDLVDEDELKAVCEYVGRMNPKAEIFRISANNPMNNQIWREVIKADE